LLAAPQVFADVFPPPGRYTVQGVLTILEGRDARLNVNPMMRNQYIFMINNVDKAIELAKARTLVKQVEAEIEVYQPQASHAQAKLLSLKPIQMDEIAQYDGPLREIKKGKPRPKIN
jgi:hypothetical protein